MKLLWLNVAITCACVRVYAKACQPGQERFGGSCYQILNRTMTWDQGDAACSGRGAALVVPDSLDEHRFIWEMFTKQVPYGRGIMVGCNDREEEGKWVQSGDGGECKFFEWGQGQPNNYRGNQDCIYLPRIYNSYMYDIHCETLAFVICESPAPPVRHRYANARSSPYCLTGHVIREFSVKSVFACGSACLGERRCRSFNLRQGGSRGKMICQLNDITVNEADDKNIQLDNDCIRSLNF